MFEDYSTFGLDISLFALTSSLILYLTGNDVTQYAGSIWRHLSELSVGIRILILVTVLVVWIVVSYLCGASILPDYDWRLMFRPDYVEVHDRAHYRRVKTLYRPSKKEDELSKEQIPSDEDLDIVTQDQPGSRPDAPLPPDAALGAPPTRKKSKTNLTKLPA